MFCASSLAYVGRASQHVARALTLRRGSAHRLLMIYLDPTYYMKKIYVQLLVVVGCL